MLIRRKTPGDVWVRRLIYLEGNRAVELGFGGLVKNGPDFESHKANKVRPSEEIEWENGQTVIDMRM